VTAVQKNLGAFRPPGRRRVLPRPPPEVLPAACLRVDPSASEAIAPLPPVGALVEPSGAFAVTVASDRVPISAYNGSWSKVL